MAHLAKGRSSSPSFVGGDGSRETLRGFVAGPLGLAELAQRALALVARRAVEDEDAVEVIHLVLDHAGLEAGGLDEAALPLLVERSHADVNRALDINGDAGDREAALVEDIL